MQITEFAPAKINLALHVTGQRADGYHLLDSLVVFADVGDSLHVRQAEHPDFSIVGPFSIGLPVTGDNLVLKALQAIAGRVEGSAMPLAVTLEKNLPVASGIGGGSADAAAMVRAANTLWGLKYSEKDLCQLVDRLGADLPMCVRSRPLRALGVGDQLSDVPDVPDLALVLVNPGIPVSTPPVFKALAVRNNPPLVLPESFPETAEGFADWLLTTRNDLEEPARRLHPIISHALDMLTGSDECLLARMSGSGATCFGLYPTHAAASEAAASIALEKSEFWCRAARLYSGLSQAGEV
ncbi:4-(cytidine 5'-diphospho)-2-C-methyl-D-erythritol kinase [Coralliovum pocilloporae]|uniref:4-(cytidine 5'-diphospho)-2-C-methyl-D-erythritol kinase n=1 Tax=Coralliovum pocilloporae TaxID=3066369 RepID=UPI00330714C0